MKDNIMYGALGALITQAGHLLGDRFSRRQSDTQQLLERYGNDIRELRLRADKLEAEVDEWKSKYFRLLAKCLNLDEEDSKPAKPDL